jgi:altered-inheritance-of-mitochondria protein 5
MGFTTGFVRASTHPQCYSANIHQLGGVTLTSAVLYLTVAMHTQNRTQQAALLRQQRQVLADFYEPKQPEPEPVNRVVPVGLVEMAKDGWNREIESVIKRAYNTDWRRVREDTEDRASAMLERIRQQSK